MFSRVATSLTASRWQPLLQMLDVTTREMNFQKSGVHCSCTVDSLPVSSTFSPFFLNPQFSSVRLHVHPFNYSIPPHLTSVIIVQIRGNNQSGSVVTLCHSLSPQGVSPGDCLCSSVQHQLQLLHVSIWLLHQFQSLVHACR